MLLWRFVLAISLMLLLGCTQFPEETTHGYAFCFHRQLSAQQPEIGDVIYVQFRIRTSDQLLFESPNGQAGMRTVLQDPSLNPIKDPDPIADVLPLMGEGDSVTVKMTVTDDMRDAFGLANASEIFYDVVIRHIGEKKVKQAGTNAPYQGGVDREKLLKHSQQLLSTLREGTAGKEALASLRSFISTRQDNETFSSGGLLLEVLAEGSGGKLTQGEKVSVRHIATHGDSLLISESITAEPFTFTIGAGQVIKAWEEAARRIGPGGKLLFAAPPALGYGAGGKPPYIGPQDTIFYYFELVE